MARDSLERKKANPECWKTRNELATFLGVEDVWVDRLRASLGNIAEKREGRTVKIFAPEWIRAWAGYQTGGGQQPEEDAGVESEWLEEKRKWSARREQLKYQQEVGELIPEADVRRGYALVANQIRKAAESACDPCRDLLEASLDDAETQLDATFDDSGSPEPQPAEPSGESDA